MNPFLAPVPILSNDPAPVGPSFDSGSSFNFSPAKTNNGGGLFGSGGLLTKAAETAIDLAGLYGTFELEKSKLKAAEKEANRNPEQVASEQRAGIIPQVVIPQDKMPLYIVGGVAAVGIVTAIVIAATRGK